MPFFDYLRFNYLRLFFGYFTDYFTNLTFDNIYQSFNVKAQIEVVNKVVKAKCSQKSKQAMKQDFF